MSPAMMKTPVKHPRLFLLSLLVGAGALLPILGSMA
jgi:hypothetical protein